MRASGRYRCGAGSQAGPVRASGRCRCSGGSAGLKRTVPGRCLSCGTDAHGAGPVQALGRYWCCSGSARLRRTVPGRCLGCGTDAGRSAGLGSVPVRRWIGGTEAGPVRASGRCRCSAGSAGLKRTVLGRCLDGGTDAHGAGPVRASVSESVQCGPCGSGAGPAGVKYARPD